MSLLKYRYDLWCKKRLPKWMLYKIGFNIKTLLWRKQEKATFHVVIVGIYYHRGTEYRKKNHVLFFEITILNFGFEFSVDTNKRPSYEYFGVQ